MYETKTKPTRDYSVDILRTIALICIVVVHQHPSQLITQIRDFDVPLMVFLSGVSYRLSNQSINNWSGYKKYIGKRFTRLIIPTWCFLLIFYAFYIPGAKLLGENLNLKDILETFLFYTNWYTWIIRVFFIIALFSPVIGYYCNKMSTRILLFVMFIVTILYELIAGLSNERWYSYLVMNVPYLCFFTLGYISDRIKKNVWTIISMIALFVFVFIALKEYNSTNSWVITTYFKYPPKLYYISYATLIICILWVSRVKIEGFFNKLRLGTIMQIIGSHTIWIYFWHIPVTIVLNYVTSIAIVKIPVAFLAACFITFVQVKIVEKIALSICNSNKSKLIKTIFIG